MTGPLEIRCSACGEDSLLRREAIYEGFKKVGERLFCSSCGHEYATEDEVSAAGHTQKASIFTDADRSQAVDIFSDVEKERNCRRCAHYVVNPFTQRCGLHGRVVEATDVCPDFEARQDDAENAESEEPSE